MARAILLGGLIPLLLPVLTAAQILPRPTPDDARRAPLPEARLEAPSDAPFTAPVPALPPPPSPGLGEPLTVVVERIELQGNTVFSDAELAKDSLLPMEKFSIGGATSVRGYRESLLVRDSGYVGSLELRHPVATLPIPGLSRDPGDGQLQLAVFADYGRGWNEDLPTPDPDDTASVGAGLRYEPGPQVQGALYCGHALEDVEQLDEDIQDEGLYFLLRISNF